VNTTILTYQKFLKIRFLVYASLASICLILVHAPFASAHTFKAEGSISAILHINPGDRPVSNTTTRYLFFIHDLDGKFSLPQCACIVSIKEKGKVVVNQPLTEDAQGVLGGTVTFSNPDVYDLILTGDPIHPGEFQPFSFDYLVRVAEGQPKPSFFSALLLGVCAVLVIVASTACWFQLRRNIREGEHL